MEQRWSSVELQAIPVGEVVAHRYRIEAVLGRGKWGVVYRARHVVIERKVALRVFESPPIGDAVGARRVLHGLTACARLNHPNTVQLLDFGMLPDGRLFEVMEFLDGATLRNELARGPVEVERALAIVVQCCASLAEAHALGVLHGDLRPENIFLLTREGRTDHVKLTDYALAPLLDGEHPDWSRIGASNAQYRSPEAGRGRPLDLRSDVYALGIVAFEMLSGRPPFHEDSAPWVMVEHLSRPLPPLPESVPPAVQRVVERALAKTPEHRFQSADEMMRACMVAFPGGRGAPFDKRGVILAMPMPTTGSGPTPLWMEAVGEPAPASRRSVAKYIVGAVVVGSAAVGAAVVTFTGGAHRVAATWRPWARSGSARSGPGHWGCGRWYRRRIRRCAV